MAASLAIVVAALSSALPPPVAGAAGPGGPYYVAVGASESVGVQPVPGSDHSASTDEGYANDLVAMEQRRWPGLHLVQFGCPGITAEGALDGVGLCHYPEGSEIRTAVDFLHAHATSTVLVTVDLGFNDVWPCLRNHRVDEACVTSAIRGIGEVLPTILAELRAAGGSHTVFVGLLHNDPYLAAYLHGLAGRAFAAASMNVVRRLNTELAAVYTAGGALVADVPALYRTTNTVVTDLAGHGDVPGGVARVCDYTWMCAAQNIHPNAAGYRLIAEAVAAALFTAPLVGTAGGSGPRAHTACPSSRATAPMVARADRSHTSGADTCDRVR